MISLAYTTYEPKCYACRSTHRDEIEQKRLEENWSYKRISEWLEEEYQEKISKQSLSGHFKKHVMESLKEARKSQIAQKELAKDETDKVLNLVDELRESISILKKMLNRLMEKEELTGTLVNAITKSLTEVRLTLKELNSLTGSLEIGSEREKSIKKDFFSKFVDKLPREEAERILKIWEETESES